MLTLQKGTVHARWEAPGQGQGPPSEGAVWEVVTCGTLQHSIAFQVPASEWAMSVACLIMFYISSYPASFLPFSYQCCDQTQLSKSSTITSLIQGILENLIDV